MTIAKIFVGPNPSEELYEQVTDFYYRHIDDKFRCTPDGIMENKQTFYRHDDMLLAVAWNEKDEIVCTFYVSRNGEAYYPMFELPYALEALIILLPEAQRVCPTKVWCKPSTKELASWVISAGFPYDKELYDKEGVLTWSSTP